MASFSIEHVNANGLIGWDTVRVLIEDMPPTLRDVIATSDVETWAANRLKSVGIAVVSREEHDRRFSAAEEATEAQALRKHDQYWSRLYINISGGRDTATGRAPYNISIEVHRGAFIYPGGFTTATVWSRALVGHLDKAVDGKESLRGGVNALLDDFEKDWKAANGK
jgi:hypothetical protein